MGESLCKKALSIGGKLEIGGRGGVKNDPKKSDIIYGRPLNEKDLYNEKLGRILDEKNLLS